MSRRILMLVAACFTARLLYAETPGSAAAVAPLDVGATIPDAALTKLDGTPVRLSELTAGKKTVLVFFRGGWCPYCTKHLAALKDVLPALEAAGVQLIAISPDSIDGALAAAREHELMFTVVSDTAYEAIGAFGLAFRLDAATLETYAGYGIHLPVRETDGATVLPVPAVYVVDAEGVIRFRHYDADYTQRLDPQALRDAALSLTP
ncbi:MAG TPA: peroxiredoxin-like family protein [Kiritimatiellia bacterium]|nr:peroxiredoxin-like family protein [Kiritimatiellia bacterium]HMP33233.1 peroxiredoxin-like family protein [Kiritimatiellia bacterium]